MAYRPIDKGQILFVGDYANINTPLWLSATNPIAPPQNLTVSTLTAGSSGGVIITANNAPLPSTQYGAVVFNRATAVSATQLGQNESKNVPTKTANLDYLTVASNGGLAYDDLALAGLQIFGNQVTNPLANTGAAGYLHQGALPYSVTLDTGLFTTGDLHASKASVSTLNVSSLTDIANFNVDTVTASTVNTNNINSANTNFSTVTATNALFNTLTSQIVNASTLNVSTFSLLNNALISSLGISTLTATNASIQNLSTGVLTAGLANISTLVTQGGGVVTSTVTTQNISSVTATLKEIFVSTMQFNATLSPNFNLDMGGIVGGLIGYAGANTLSVGLGAVNLATGIASLAQARQSGGINSNVFQTVNGTTQLQFSTLGQSTVSIFTLTDAVDYTHNSGNPVYVSSIIGAGTYAVRSVSDPLNLANADGNAGRGIQGYSQWFPVYPGALQVGTSSITMEYEGNFGNHIEIEASNGAGFMEIKAINGLGIRSPSIYMDSGFTGLTTMTADAEIYGHLTVGQISSISSIKGQGAIGIYPGIITSTLSVSSLNVGIVTQPAFIASSITTNTLTVNNNAIIGQTVRLATGGGALGSLGVFIGQTVTNPPLNGNSLSVQSDIQCDSFSSRSILATQGQFFVQGDSQLKSATISTLTAGSISTPTLVANTIATPLINATNLNGLGMTPYPPTNSSPGTQWGTFVIAGFRITWGIVNGNGGRPYYSTAYFSPPFGQAPLVFLTSLTYFNVPSWWSVVDRQTTGMTCFGLNEPGTPFNTQCQWVAIGPA